MEIETPDENPAGGVRMESDRVQDVMDAPNINNPSGSIVVPASHRVQSRAKSRAT